jgi:hypothetical protein
MQRTVRLGRVISVAVLAISVAACANQQMPEEAARSAAMASVAKAVPPEVVQFVACSDKRGGPYRVGGANRSTNQHSRLR